MARGFRMGAAVSGGSQPTTMDLLAQTWDTLPTASKSTASGSTSTWTMAGKTPVLTSLSAVSGTFNNYSPSTVTVRVQVSEDGTNWTTVITAAGGGGTAKNASLSAYSGKQLFIRCTAQNASANTLSIKAVYHSSNPIFIIS